MTDPRDQDDSWGELYRELGVSDPETPKATPRAEEEVETEEEYEVLEVVELTDSGPDELPAEGSEDLVEGEYELAEGTAEGEGEGEPGQKKRRRRRRRRKKKGVAGQPGGEETNGLAAEADESDTPLEDDNDSPEAITGPGVEDEVTPEMTRDIIANWNVPSWEEIVAGLHRPER